MAKEKLYYPAYASIRYKECEDYDDIDYWRDDLSRQEAVQYFDKIDYAILKDVKRTMDASGLMEYFRCDDQTMGKSIKNKVSACIPSVEIVKGELFGVMELEMKEPLTVEEMAVLKDDILGSLADGWGEGFEQREIKVSDGDLYVEFWSSNKDYFIDTQSEFENRMGIIQPHLIYDEQNFTQQM